MAYIYEIKNDINDKIYIGKTQFSIEKRFQQHCRDAFRISEEHRPLYAAMRKYGIEHFHISLIEETDSPEERQIYWIEQKQSFKYGYNATKGGDGKRYIDYDMVIAVYNQCHNCITVAQQLGISADSVREILHANNISIMSGAEVNQRERSKVVHMYDLNDNYLQSFVSSHEAARFLENNNLTNCKHSTARQHISQVCNGKRKTFAKYKWSY